MNHTVPPSFDLEENSFVSFVGVGMRELVMVGGGLILGILVGIVLPAGWPVKIGAGALLCACGMWLAIGREPGSRRTFEDIFLDFIRFQQRPRVHQRGYQPTPEEDPFTAPAEIHNPENGRHTPRETLPSLAEQETHAEGLQSSEHPQGSRGTQPPPGKREGTAETGWDVSQLPDLETLSRMTGWFKVKPIPLTTPMLMNLLGFALLVGLLAWVWMGGLETAWLRWSGF